MPKPSGKHTKKEHNPWSSWTSLCHVGYQLIQLISSYEFEQGYNYIKYILGNQLLSGKGDS
jgi:hypothetical protein